MINLMVFVVILLTAVSYDELNYYVVDSVADAFGAFDDVVA
jgi:hypothetical protein